MRDREALAGPAGIATLGRLAVLVVITVALYSGAQSYPFARDDAAHFAQTERWSRGPAQWARSFGEEFWGGEQRSGLYRPVTAVTIQGQAHYSELEPPPLRRGNVLIHVLAALSLFVVALRLKVSRTLALAAAAGFAWHPLASEPVLEVVSRSESLALLFTLIAAAQLLRGSRLCVVLGAIAWGMALLSKESSMGALPALGLALVVGSRRSSPVKDARALTVGTVALGAVLLGYFILRRVALGAFFGLDQDSISPLDNPLVQVGAGERIATAFSLVPRYLWLVVWPAQLSPDYSMAAIPVASSLLGGASLLGLLLTAGIATWCLRAWKKQRRAECFGLLLAVGTYLPISNLAFPIGTVMAERLFYTPLAGLILAVCGAMARVVSAKKESAEPSAPAVRWVDVAIGVVILSGLGARTLYRTSDWENAQVLYESAVEVVPDSARVQCNLGFQKMQRKQAAEAEPFLRRALEIYPDYLKAHSQLALCRLSRGDPAEALVHFHRAASHAQATRDDLRNYLEAVRRLPGGGTHRAIARELIDLRLEEDPDDPELQRLHLEFR